MNVQKVRISVWSFKLCKFQASFSNFIRSFIGGGNTIKKDLFYSIKEYLKLNSTVGSNRLVKSKPLPKALSSTIQQPNLLTTRYLNDTKAALYKKFPFRNHISKSSFYRYIKAANQFKKPHRLTDLCDYCEWAKKTSRNFNEIMQTENYSSGDTFNPTHFKDFMKERIIHYQEVANGGLPTTTARLNQAQDRVEAYTKLLPEIDSYKDVMFHKFIANSQREAYNSQRKDVEILRQHIIIEADYKQKILIGMGPRQPNKEYYEQTLRNCLGRLRLASYFFKNTT